MYRDLQGDRASIAREFEFYCESLGRSHPDVRKAYAFLYRIVRLAARSIFEKQLAEFDMTGISEARRLVDGTFFAMPLPVEFYGVRLSRRLRRTVQVMTLLLERDAREELKTIERRAPRLIARETTRGRAVAQVASGQFEEKDPVLSAIVEGFYTIAQTINFLLVDEVPGDLDAVRLVGELTTPSGSSPSAVALMTLYSRIAMLGPSTLTGSRFPHPLERDQDGHLTLSQSFKVDLSARLAANFSKESSYNGRKWRNYRRGVACPVARDFGIEIASASFRRIFEMIGD